MPAKPPPWNHKEYWVFCDESISNGSHYSDFFGGAVLPASFHDRVEGILQETKRGLGFGMEMKWQRVCPLWLEGYKVMVSKFFELIGNGDVRVRVLFRKTDHSRIWTRQEIDDRYFKIYYQFIKHAYGLQHAPCCEAGTRIRLFFDQFSDESGKIEQFKGFIHQLPVKGLAAPGLLLHPSHVVEVDSKKSMILQCVDIVMGSMAFTLNQMHLTPPKGGQPLGKRTHAKFELYRHILKEIRALGFLYTEFAPPSTTACSPFPAGNWLMPYRHWQFKSKG